MKKGYFFFFTCIICLFFVQNTNAQKASTPIHHQQSIEGLSFYPNPVKSETGYITISSKLNSIKKIDIYNVLGKQLLTLKLKSKELNISNLKKGVYILKITENNVSETRKLIVL
ncbi:T9SS type A sorting domain-containing protein [Pseudotamlana carrageenivorans]|uniref:Secretion system C-terminal sorting domain-containing protein n=1 Tax=Pseudotamlana carrageenivorans TaxID=2069432 RepID=A0A2I7SID1_9FLAO|nr:T9SS type A sorting domain-containing protein [Tamlana carrageenivorans]AUS05653.1 hypothetical protein C1A40_09330 [Tamlana carrageenivorans]